MSSHLLQVVELPHVKSPILMDRVPVPYDPNAEQDSEDSGSGPYLITSSKSLLWIERAFPGGFLRVAVRQHNLTELYASLVQAIAQEGQDRDWGNVFPPTVEGVVEAVKYLEYYDLTPVDLLHGSDFDLDLPSDIYFQTHEVPWLEPNSAVLLPTRDFVGTCYVFSKGHMGALVHNPSRGVVVLK